MSSTSSSRSRPEAAEASSSRSPYIENLDDDLDVTQALDADQTADLLDSDPLNGSLDKRYVSECYFYTAFPPVT